ncbi:MAG: hypothetical protein GEU86_15985 [Actinophytocola sp.]|nr:hypothetical protein [Actinophytocola sp.]
MPRPARDRPGKAAWLGPLALGLGLLCWLAPVGSELVASAAITSGAVSIVTRRGYRIDWAAAAGIFAGTLHLYVAVMLFAITIGES